MYHNKLQKPLFSAETAASLAILLSKLLQLRSSANQWILITNGHCINTTVHSTESTGIRAVFRVNWTICNRELALILGGLLADLFNFRSVSLWNSPFAGKSRRNAAISTFLGAVGDGILFDLRVFSELPIFSVSFVTVAGAGSGGSSGDIYGPHYDFADEA